MDNNVVPFVPRNELSAKNAVSDYVAWAKSQLHWYDRPADPVIWSDISWTHWGIRDAIVSRLGKRNESFHPDFVDFAKAYLFEVRAVKQDSDGAPLMALRVLEKALLDATNNGDITTISGAVMDKAINVAQGHYNQKTAYRAAAGLKTLIDLLHQIGAVNTPFIWEHNLRCPRYTLEESEKAAKNKLPSEGALIALGEIFSNKPDHPLDIMTTSAVALLLSQPSRISELFPLRKDCLFTEVDSKGREQLYIIWYSNKGFGANRKPVPDSMAEVCKEAVNRVLEISQDARESAKWLEDNPEKFPPHDQMPKKKADDLLTEKEACDALTLSYSSASPRTVLAGFLSRLSKRKRLNDKSRQLATEILKGYDTKGVRLYGATGAIKGMNYSDSWQLTLRKLNILVRAAYLNEDFPFQDSKRMTKWKDALFCFRTGSLTINRSLTKTPFGFIGCDKPRLSDQLSGARSTVPSIFERHGYRGISVNSHSFRHLLNTAAQRSNLSQELIARWSGRLDLTQNRIYNHMSVSEKTDEVAQFAPKPFSGSELISKLKTNSPIRMKDIGGDTDRVVHRTEFGICIHDYAEEPCGKFNNCLACGEHICIKGEKVKLRNLREERDYLRRCIENYELSTSDGVYGANTWLDSTSEKLNRCSQLIELLESDDIEEGALINGVENGWSASTNALALNGAISDQAVIGQSDDCHENRFNELEQLLKLDV